MELKSCNCAGCPVKERITHERSKAGEASPKFGCYGCSIKADIIEEEDEYYNTITFSCHGRQYKPTFFTKLRIWMEYKCTTWSKESATSTKEENWGVLPEVPPHKKAISSRVNPQREASPQNTQPYKYCLEVECSSCFFVSECNYVKSKKG